MTETEAILLYQPLIKGMAYQFSKARAFASEGSIDQDDLEQEASIAVINAFRKQALEGGECTAGYLKRAVMYHLLTYSRKVSNAPSGVVLFGEENNVDMRPLEDAHSVKAFDYLTLLEKRLDLISIVDELFDYQSASMFKLYFGLDDGDALYSYQEIGDMFGLTRQRVGHIITGMLSDDLLVTLIAEVLEE